MGSIDITPEVWIAEEHVAEAYRATHDDHLPSTPFWLLVDAHYLLARDTCRLTGFEHWHGPVITSWEEQNYAHPAPVPVCIPTIPVTPVQPGSPIGSPGPGTGSGGGSGTGSSAVPEPSAILLLGLGLTLSLIVARLLQATWLLRVARPKRRHDVSDYCNQH